MRIELLRTGQGLKYSEEPERIDIVHRFRPTRPGIRQKLHICTIPFREHVLESDPCPSNHAIIVPVRKIPKQPLVCNKC